MKKVLKTFLFACVVMFGIVTFAACGSSKEEIWSGWELLAAPTCSTQGIESRTSSKGKTEVRTVAVDANAHAWCNCWHAVEATACDGEGQEQRMCVYCGETENREVFATGHKWSEWIVIKPAKCEAEGLQKRLCLGCGNVETEVIPAAGHQFGEWTIIKEATCTHSGKQFRCCAACNEKEFETIPSLGSHAFGDWQIIKEATCTHSGKESLSCTNCDEMQIRKIPALGHNYILTQIASTCEDEGYDLYTCSNCNDSYKENALPALGHCFDDWYTALSPTRDADGYEERICETCGKAETRELPSIVKRLSTAAENFIEGVGNDIAGLGNGTSFMMNPANYTDLAFQIKSSDILTNGNGSASIVNGLIKVSGFNNQSHASAKFKVVITLEGVRCELDLDILINYSNTNGGYGWTLANGSYKIL